MEPASPPKVSVCMIAYAHEATIEQAVASALAQDTDFPLEIVVGEDCSPDGTRERLRALAREAGPALRVLERERNLGPGANFLATFAACRGEYVALLEGDDYWTSPHKLQRQVELLDARPEVMLCAHSVELVQLNGGSFSPSRFRVAPQVECGLDEILAENFLPTASVVLRNRPGLLPPWFAELPMCDWPLWILCAQAGRIVCLEECMAAYRCEGGTWSAANDERRLRAQLAAFLPLRSVLSGSARRLLDARLCRCHIQLSRWYREQGQARRAGRELLEAARYSGDRGQLLRATLGLSASTLPGPIYQRLRDLKRALLPLDSGG